MNCTPKVLCLIFGIQCKRPNDFEVSLLRISIHFIEIKVVNMRNRFLCIRYIKKILYFFLFLFSAVFGWETATLSAQQTEETVLQGIVTNNRKEPLPGVTVRLDGTSIGVATDDTGKYVFRIPVKMGTLLFTFIGYKEKKIPFSINNRHINVILEEDIQNLDEAVVVGYGTTTRREATGAISVIKAEDLEGLPSANISNLLQGRVAGMDVTNMSGAPGSGGTAITIRGYNSLDVEQGRRYSNPLWVVDGVPLNSFTSPVTGTNLLSDLNPDMIESIQILKDASSAAIYGSRAANGVIVVTTKKGNKNQKATFSVNASQSWSILPKLPTVTIGRAERLFRLEQNKRQMIAYKDPETGRYKYPTSWKEIYEVGDGVLDQNWSPHMSLIPKLGTPLEDSLNSFYANSTNFFPMYYHTGKITNANIQAYGGLERMTYGIGLGYYNEDGILKGTGYNRIDLNSQMNVTPVERFNIDLRFNASIAGRMRGVKSGQLTSTQNVETVPGDPYKLATYLPGKGSFVWDKIIEQYKGIKERNRSVRLRSNFRLNLNIIEGLDVSTSLAADYSIERRNYFAPGSLNIRGWSTSLGETGINLMVLNENLINYKKTFNDDHTVTFVGGFSYQYDQIEYTGGLAQNSPSDLIEYAPGGLPNISIEGSGDYEEAIAMKQYISDMQEKKLLSWFARLEYNYRQKYLLSASIRRDGSSTFGKNNKWGTFPSIAAGWTFTEEAFMKSLSSWFNFGKIRASWGTSGMHFHQNYLALGIMQVDNSSYLGSPVITPEWSTGLYNQDLSWEKTKQYDFGLDLNFLNYRLGATLDYYYRYTDDLLLPVPLPGDYNGYGQQWRNAAAISNEGLEFMVEYKIFDRPDLYWRISVNSAKNWNRFEKSYDGHDLDGKVIGKPLNQLQALITEGFINEQSEVPTSWKTDGSNGPINVGPTYMQPGDYKIVDVNGDGTINNNDLVYVGSALPEISGGIINEVRWKNFDLNVLFSYQLGRHILNTFIPQSLEANNDYNPLLIDINKTSFWEKAGDDADYARLQPGGGDNHVFDYLLDRHIEKVNWLKLKTLTLGYTLPQRLTQKWYIDQLRIFFSGENLFTCTNYSGMDPETVDISTGIDGTLAGGGSYPLARKLTVGITIKF